MKEILISIFVAFSLWLFCHIAYSLVYQKGFSDGYFVRTHPECDIWSKRWNPDLCEDALPTAPVGTLSWATSTPRVQVKDQKATRTYDTINTAVTSEDTIRTQTAVARCTHPDGTVTETPVYESDSFIMHGECSIVSTNTH